MVSARIKQFFPLAGMLFAGFCPWSNPSVQAQDRIPAGVEWLSLFNGTDLSGWEMAGKEKWYVENGEIVGESGPRKEYGYLFTTEPYLNFELYLEYQLEGEGNSGVFFRSALDENRISGWQAEVAPPGEGSGGIFETHGRGWLARADEEEPVIPGGWNQLRIRVKGGTVTTWLNGKKNVRVKDEKINTGRGVIALQIHEGGKTKIRWRNIYIKILN